MCAKAMNEIDKGQGTAERIIDRAISEFRRLGADIGAIELIDTALMESERVSGQINDLDFFIDLDLAYDGETTLHFSLQVLPEQAISKSDAINAVFVGDVISIGQVARSVSGIKQYEVLVEVTEIPTGARFGMSATAEIEVERSASVLAVPFSALIGELPEVQILVTSATGEQTVTTVEVKLGIRGDSLVEITSGLKSGDLVVIGIAGGIPSPVEFGPPAGARNNG
jgi:multidrug efflux pump subunit AcrA (membrane-fusion protein)